MQEGGDLNNKMAEVKEGETLNNEATQDTLKETINKSEVEPEMKKTVGEYLRERYDDDDFEELKISAESVSKINEAFRAPAQPDLQNESNGNSFDEPDRVSIHSQDSELGDLGGEMVFAEDPEPVLEKNETEESVPVGREFTKIEINMDPSYILPTKKNMFNARLHIENAMNASSDGAKVDSYAIQKINSDKDNFDKITSDDRVGKIDSIDIVIAALELSSTCRNASDAIINNINRQDLVSKQNQIQDVTVMQSFGEQSLAYQDFQKESKLLADAMEGVHSGFGGHDSNESVEDRRDKTKQKIQMVMDQSTLLDNRINNFQQEQTEENLQALRESAGILYNITAANDNFKAISNSAKDMDIALGNIQFLASQALIHNGERESKTENPQNFIGSISDQEIKERNNVKHCSDKINALKAEISNLKAAEAGIDKDIKSSMKYANISELESKLERSELELKSLTAMHDVFAQDVKLINNQFKEHYFKEATYYAHGSKLGDDRKHYDQKIESELEPLRENLSNIDTYSELHDSLSDMAIKGIERLDEKVGLAKGDVDQLQERQDYREKIREDDNKVKAAEAEKQRIQDERIKAESEKAKQASVVKPQPAKTQSPIEKIKSLRDNVKSNFSAWRDGFSAKKNPNAKFTDTLNAERASSGQSVGSKGM